MPVARRRAADSQAERRRLHSAAPTTRPRAASTATRATFAGSRPTACWFVAAISAPCVRRTSASCSRRRAARRSHSVLRRPRSAIRATFDRRRAPVRAAQVCAGLCLAQGIPAAVIDTYVFPTTATAGVTQGNPDLRAGDCGHLQLRPVVDLAFFRRRCSADCRRRSTTTASRSRTSSRSCPDCPRSASATTSMARIPSYSADNQFCQLLTRDANGLLQLIETPYLNLGGLEDRGRRPAARLGHRRRRPLDAALQYRRRLLDRLLRADTAGLGLPGFHWHEHDRREPHGVEYVSGVEGADDRSASRFGPVAVSVRWRYQDAMDDVTSVTTPATPGVGVATYNLYDFLRFVRHRRQPGRCGSA